MARNKTTEPEKEKQLSFMVYPDKELREKLDALAAEERRSLSGLASYILKEYFKLTENAKS